MGVSFEKFSFTKSTSVASQEINLTGAFQPKALILGQMEQQVQPLQNIWFVALAFLMEPMTHV